MTKRTESLSVSLKPLQLINLEHEPYLPYFKIRSSPNNIIVGTTPKQEKTLPKTIFFGGS
jgi:hypothetical protein